MFSTSISNSSPELARKLLALSLFLNLDLVRFTR